MIHVHFVRDGYIITIISFKEVRNDIVHQLHYASCQLLCLYHLLEVYSSVGFSHCVCCLDSHVFHRLIIQMYIANLAAWLINPQTGVLIYIFRYTYNLHNKFCYHGIKYTDKTSKTYKCTYLSSSIQYVKQGWFSIYSGLLLVGVL